MRNEYAHNFLKKVIVRFDFFNIFETDAEEFSANNLRDICNKVQLNEISSGYDSNASIKLEGNQDIEIMPILDDYEKTKTWSFKKADNNGIVEIKMCKNYFYVLIDVNNKYDSIKNYLNSISEIINSLCKSYPNIVITRLGIRKTNCCLVNETANINDYFKKSAIDFCKIKNNKKELKIQALTEASLLMKDNIYVNFARNIQLGQTPNGEQYYQVILDIDSFITNKDYLANEIQGINEIIKKLNKTLFDMFDSSLTKKFKDKLMDIKFDDKNIKGVN